MREYLWLGWKLCRMQVKWLEMFVCGSNEFELEIRTPATTWVSLNEISLSVFGSNVRSKFYSIRAIKTTPCARIDGCLFLYTFETHRLCLVTMVTRRLPIHRTACCRLLRSLFNFDGSSHSHTRTHVSAHTNATIADSTLFLLQEIDAKHFLAVEIDVGTWQLTRPNRCPQWKIMPVFRAGMDQNACYFLFKLVSCRFCCRVADTADNVRVYVHF